MPAPATESTLERAALAYVERYGGSSVRVRRALSRRVDRSVEEHGTDREEGRRAVEAVIAKLVRLGYVDDERFAAAKVRAMRRRGKSSRAMRAALAAEGLDAGVVEQALVPEEGVDAELGAARALVRRRRLGPLRPAEEREAERERDLARLARAGFSYAIAVRALGEPADE